MGCGGLKGCGDKEGEEGIFLFLIWGAAGADGAYASWIEKRPV